MTVTRRMVLQQGGLALAMWGASEFGLWKTSRRYTQALAASTSRRLALLVGINQYLGSASLEGAVTDVELQRELLIYRFGFQPADVLVLTNEQATQAAIAAAFIEHLGQAKSEDIAIFHFSGFGITLRPDPQDDAGLSAAPATQRGFVTADPVLAEDVAANVLLEATLARLARSLKTTRLTTVLDTSYTYPGQALQGNLRVRSWPNFAEGRSPTLAQLAASQDRLLSPFNLPAMTNPPRLEHLGTVLAAAAPGQVALEARWNRFSAGLFTQALTQSLWQTRLPAQFSIVLGRATAQVNQLAMQQQPALFESSPASQKGESLLAAPPSALVAGAAGAIIAIADPDQLIQLWLGGLAAPLLEHYGAQSIFTVLSDSQEAPIQVQLVAREGLLGKARVVGEGGILPTVRVGQRVQEAVRVLPRSIGLTVALDGNLERIERVDAVSALSAVPHVSSAIAGEQSADYVFSKIPTKPITQIAALPTVPLTAIAPTVQTGYGLFSLGRDALPNTTGEGGEAVKVAVRRLTPKLQALLSSKLLNLTINDRTSQLRLRATLETLTPQPQVVLQRATSLGAIAGAPRLEKALPPDILQLPVGSRIRYRVENAGDRPIYALLLAFDSANSLVVLHASAHPSPDLPSPDPSSPDSPSPDLPTNRSVLLPKATLNLPIVLDSEAGWVLQTAIGMVESYLICSSEPFQQTLVLLPPNPRANPSMGTMNANPLEVSQAILQDLHQAAGQEGAALPPDVFALNVNTWATFRFTIQVI
jgi:Caspase domain